MDVQVPIELLCEGCLTCKDLTIKDDEIYVFAPGKIWLDVAHHFSCKNLDRCLIVKHALEKELKTVRAENTLYNREESL